MKRRIAGAYVSSVISISLVLMLVGAAVLTAVNARDVTRYFKESLQLSVMLRQDVTDAGARACQASIDSLPFIHGSTLVSREEGLEQMKAMLGEDFLSVFTESPIPVSINVTLRSDYVSADSVAVVRNAVRALPQVDDLEFRQPLLDALNANLRKVSAVLGILIALMLFISFVLINNTVRLNVFRHRFTVHTMRLVGATKGFIRRPYLRRAVLQGLVSSLLASGAILLALSFVRRSFPQLYAVFTPGMTAVALGIVVAAGVLICVLSTYFVVGKLISMDKDELYG